MPLNGKPTCWVEHNTYSSNIKGQEKKDQRIFRELVKGFLTIKGQNPKYMCIQFSKPTLLKRGVN